MPGLNNNNIRGFQERNNRQNQFRQTLSPIIEEESTEEELSEVESSEEAVMDELAANGEIINTVDIQMDNQGDRAVGVNNQTNNLVMMDYSPTDSSYSSIYGNSSKVEQKHIDIINRENYNGKNGLTSNGNLKRKHGPEGDYNNGKRGRLR